MAPATILKLLKQLNPAKSAGIDNLTGKFLKEGAPVLASPITDLVNLSISLSLFPDDCKIAKLKPLYKKEAKTKPKNYSLRSIDSLSKFKAELIKSLRPPKRSVFKISDIVGVRLLTRLRLGFSHLREHKFRHNVSNSSRCIAVMVMKRLNISSYVAIILLTFTLLCWNKCPTS